MNMNNVILMNRAMFILRERKEEKRLLEQILLIFIVFYVLEYVHE